jgi:hypothetical protein
VSRFWKERDRQK